MKVELECTQCGEKFLRERGEVNRNIKRGRDSFFCSRSCGSKHQADHLANNLGENLGVVRHNFTRRVDEFSPFRVHVRSAKQRASKSGVPFEIDVEYLKELWEKQNGRCPYSGVALTNPTNYAKRDQGCKKPERASLDRVDSSLGYVKGNVEFVSMIAQFAKNDWSREEVLSFFRTCVSHTGSSSSG